MGLANAEGANAIVIQAGFGIRRGMLPVNIMIIPYKKKSSFYNNLLFMKAV